MAAPGDDKEAAAPRGVKRSLDDVSEPAEQGQSKMRVEGSPAARRSSSIGSVSSVLTSPKSSQSKAGLRECPVCMEEYNGEGRAPRSLPCGHTHCQVCSEQLLREGKGEAVCSVCRKGFKFESVEGIPKNFALLDVLSALPSSQGSSSASSSDVPCCHCEAAAAALHCVDCKGDYCEGCFKDVHSRGVLKTHKSVPVSAKPEPEPRCAEHQERLSIWCDKCKVSICLVCKEEGSAHFNHATKAAAAVVVSTRADLQKRVADADAVLEELYKRERAVAEALDAITSAEAEATRALSQAAEQLLSAVRKRKEELEGRLKEESQRLRDVCLQAREAASTPATAVVAAIEEAKWAAASSDALLLQRVGSAVAQVEEAVKAGAALLASPLSLPPLRYNLAVDDLLVSVSRFGGVGVPEAVSALRVLPTAPIAYFEWKPPAALPLLPITEFRIEYARLQAAGEGKADAKAEAAPECEWRGLPSVRASAVLTASLKVSPAASYAVRVRAVNAAGVGEWSRTDFTAALWKFAPSDQIQLASDRSAVAQKQPSTVRGDVTLDMGRHAWRVTCQDMPAPPGSTHCAFGIARQGEGTMWHSVWTSAGFVSTAGKLSRTGGFDNIWNGDRADLLLDVEKRSLVAFSLKDGKRHIFSLPAPVAWVPYFYLGSPGIRVSVEVIDPEQAGSG